MRVALRCSASVRNGSGITAASTLPLLSGPSICGNGISTKRTSPAPTPFRLSHRNSPIWAGVFGASIAIVFPTRSLARLNRFPFAETSAVVGTLGR
jgi:hypothetical protein